MTGDTERWPGCRHARRSSAGCVGRSPARPARGNRGNSIAPVRSKHAVRLVAIGVVLVTSSSAVADGRPPLSMAKARGAIHRFVQDGLNRADGGVATVGSCSRLATWKVRCTVTIGYANGSACVAQIAASTRRGHHDHHKTRFSHCILSCRPPPTSRG